MYKDGVITISNWQKGIADSAYTGFQNMRNVDIFSKKGVLRSAYRLTNQLSTTGLPIKRIVASNGDVYVLVRNSTSAVYKNGTLLTNVTGYADDMVEYKGFLIIAHGANLDAYGTTTSTAYFASFKTSLDSNYYHKMLIGIDGILYISNGNTIVYINTLTTGGFAVAPTCTITTGNLVLPSDQFIVTIEELGSKIMCGTQGGATWSARGAQRIAKIFPWDRASTLPNNPISLNECGIQAMLAVGNYLYVIAGIQGNIYKTDGTNYAKIQKIPLGADRSYLTSISFYPNAICLGTNGNLLIGTSLNSGTVNQLGVYSMELDSGYPIVMEKTISTGNYNTNISIGCISGGNLDTMFVGWQDGASYGMDYIVGDSSYSSYTAVIETPIIVVGTKLKTKSFSSLEFRLGKPLITLQGVKIEYRKNNNAAYTTIGTFDFATLGAVISHNTKALIVDAEILQFRISITQDTTNSYSDGIELLTILLW